MPSSPSNKKTKQNCGLATGLRLDRHPDRGDKSNFTPKGFDFLDRNKRKMPKAKQNDGWCWIVSHRCDQQYWMSVLSQEAIQRERDRERNRMKGENIFPFFSAQLCCLVLVAAVSPHSARVKPRSNSHSTNSPEHPEPSWSAAWWL